MCRRVTLFSLIVICLILFCLPAESVHHGGMHKGMHQMPKASAEFHRLVEEPESHPDLKHYFNWRNKEKDIGAGAKAFRGKVPEDLIHYVVKEKTAQR
mmetsp:Transcript_23665/g.56504  ORF Transcript_23665/g.56504 Transcript_23665/m.56504 type:complete len:98 (-) Transcript_23665:146-439(-)